jgi:hypothetical protein
MLFNPGILYIANRPPNWLLYGPTGPGKLEGS